MLWIIYRSREFIPRKLYCCKGSYTVKDNNGQTPLMLWVRYHENKGTREYFPKGLCYKGY